ncbi:TetR/AcrR family transcriptional regulator [Salinisphaera aquimarina]|uniref:TetR/AcrR family transcriptional regulator n=1 Tax=Salinisphaera aquimarina TaxID=2094031 RepID=A0ABV7EL90_9GAMM
MKVSRAESEANRRRIVDRAAALFRERGFDGVGVAELMKAAGLTHGGFYGHFASKDELIAEACLRAIEQTGDRWQTLLGANEAMPLDAMARQYLSRRHRDNPGDGCVLASLGAEASRASPAVRGAFTRSVRRFIGLLESAVPRRTEARRRQQGVAACASLVGAVVLARAVDDASLSDEILAAVRAELAHGDAP